MTTFETKFEYLKPGVSKHTLLFIAGIAWTIAGGMLLLRAGAFLYEQSLFSVLPMLASVLGGIVFYLLLFRKISGKHISRIQTLSVERPFFLAFFKLKSYLFLPLMIGMGVLIRKTGIVPMQQLSYFYIVMGTPLILSAVRFYYSFARRANLQ